MVMQYANRPREPEVLPDEVFRDPRGRLMHYRLRFVGFVTEDDQPWNSPEDGERFEVHDEIPYPCLVPPEYAEPDEIESLRKRAVNLQQDFLHPDHGWLYGGRRRVVDWPENRGSGSVRRSRRRTASPLEVEAPSREEAAAEIEAVTPVTRPSRARSSVAAALQED